MTRWIRCAPLAAAMCVLALARVAPADPEVRRPVDIMDHDSPLLRTVILREKADEEFQGGAMFISRRDALSLARWAEMSPAQRDAAVALVDAYVSEWRDASVKIDAYVRAAYGDAEYIDEDPERWAAVSAVQRDYEKAQERRLDRLSKDVDALLTPEQAAFTGWMRDRHDARSMTRLEINPGDVIDALEATLRTRVAPPGVAELVGAWRRETGRQVAVVVKARADLLELRNSDADDQTRQATFDELNARTRAAAVEMFSLTRTTAERIVRMLSEEDAPAFQFRVLAPTLAERHRLFASTMVLRALMLEDVPDDTSRELATLRAEVLRQAVAACQDAWSKFERPAEVPLHQVQDRMLEELEDDTNRVYAELRRLLTPAQLERIGLTSRDEPVPLPNFEVGDEPEIVLRDEVERRDFEYGMRNAGRWFTLRTELSVLRHRGLNEDELAAAESVIESANAQRSTAARRMAASLVEAKRAGARLAGDEDWYDASRNLYLSFMLRVTDEMLDDLEIIFGPEREVQLRGVKAAVLSFNPFRKVAPYRNSLDLRGLLRATPGGGAHAAAVEPLLEEFEIALVAGLEREYALRRGLLESQRVDARIPENFEREGRLWGEVHQLRIAGARLSHQYARRIAAAIGGDVGDAFESLALDMQGFDDPLQVRGATNLDQLERAIRDFGGLPAEQLDATMAMLRRAKKERLATMRELAGKLFGEDATPEVRLYEVWDDARELKGKLYGQERDAIKNILASLSPEHRARLPAPFTSRPLPPAPSFD
jgi:hypothetical protein